MKTYLTFSLIFFLFLLFGCTGHKPSVVFEEPQPVKEKDQIRFKNKFIGTYLNIGDSSILVITSQMILKENNLLLTQAKKELDTMPGYKIKNDSLFGAEFPLGTPVKIIRDTAYFNWTIRDTVFIISNANVLRYFKGSYFLNFLADSNKWEVRKLEFTAKNKLVYSEIRKDEIDNLKKVTEVKEIKNGTPSDTLPANITYIVKPSKKDFKKFIRSGGFTGKEEYVKVRLIKR